MLRNIHLSSKTWKHFVANPLQGAELSPGIRKIRMAIKSKGKGKSGGARIITYNFLVSEMDGKIVLLLIYDKDDASTAKVNVLKEIIKEEGYPLKQLKGCSIQEASLNFTLSQRHIVNFAYFKLIIPTSLLKL